MKKSIGFQLLSLGSLFLILLAILGLNQRQGTDKFQSLPALIVGTGLIVSGALGRSRRRDKLLKALRKTNAQE